MAEQNKNQNNAEQDINQLRKVRFDKLKALQEAGKDPFQITTYDQTHHTDDVKRLYEEKEAEILKDYTEPDLSELEKAAAADPDNKEAEVALRQAKKEAYNARREKLDADPVQVSIAGRMMFKRVMGKASFANIQDLKGRIQIYVSRDAIGEDA